MDARNGFIHGGYDNYDNYSVAIKLEQAQKELENLRNATTQRASSQILQQHKMNTMAPHIMDYSRKAELLASSNKNTIIQSPWNSEQNFVVEGAQSPKEAYAQLLVKGFLKVEDIPKEYLPNFVDSSSTNTRNPNMCSSCNSWLFQGSGGMCGHCGSKQVEFEQNYKSSKEAPYNPSTYKDTCESCGEKFSFYDEGVREKHYNINKYGYCGIKQEKWWVNFRKLYWHRRSKQPELFVSTT